MAFIREENRLTVSTENLGLSVKSIMILPENTTDDNAAVYAALTGDQCALTNIRITESAGRNSKTTESTCKS